MNPSPSPISPATSNLVRKSDPVKLTAKSCLYEICAQSHWNPPVFDCCNEEGPDNFKLFTYRVRIEVKEGSDSNLVVECIGKPQASKKSAADSAADGALWYLVQLGYPEEKPNPNKKLKI